MSTATPDNPLPLDEVMLAMDVVDTLRHRQDLALRELDTDAREAGLIDRLREIYHEQGIEVPNHILEQGVAALAESRFTYELPKPGFKVSLAKLYVGRRRWGPAMLAVLVAMILVFGAYFLAYRPYQARVAEEARIELAEALPAQMDQIYAAIFEETKVQTAIEQAEQAVQRGKALASEGDREGALAAITALEGIRDTLRREYSLRVVNREDVDSGFWTFPEVNTDATNYYIVVEAVTLDGTVLDLPIESEETGETETVSMWGLRVPQEVYKTVAADKLDDGIIQRNIVGVKQYGFLDAEYSVPVLGGAVTQW
jgi:hypothetical protein